MNDLLLKDSTNQKLDPDTCGKKGAGLGNPQRAGKKQYR
jgi:hypothetical protein